MSCIFTEKVTLPQVFFKHFASKNQLPGLSVSDGRKWVNSRNIRSEILSMILETATFQNINEW